MKRVHYFNILICAAFALFFAAAAFAQAEEAPASPETEAVPPAQEMPQPRETAIYGEVQSVDAAAGSLDVQYYDYDSDSEKTATIMVDSESKIENADTLDSIKKGDWADVTYIVRDGNNVAKLITVEKEELPAAESATEGVATVPPME